MSGVPPWAERRSHRVLRAVRQRPLSTAEIERTMRHHEPGSSDRADMALKLRATVRRLARRGHLVATPAGWRPTPSGLQLITQKEPA